MVIHTVGHGTLDAGRFTELLDSVGIEVLVDIRRYPGSRRFPHFGADAMAEWLGEAGIEHRWVEDLGGRRRPAPDSPNTAWNNDQFRAYADHMATSEFVRAIDDLLATARQRPTAVMCSEAVWWRCHRRLVADYLVLIHQVETKHLFHDGRVAVHTPMKEARLSDGVVIYDA